MRRMRLFEELLDMREETNRFFDDVMARLMLFERAMSRWNAITDDRAFESEMTRFLRPSAAPAFGGRRVEVAISSEATPRNALPATLDISENPNELVAEIALPGLSPGELHIHVDSDCLTLQGRFSQTIQLPPGMDGDRIRAHYANGTLRLSLPKPAAPGREIPIQFEP